MRAVCCYILRIYIMRMRRSLVQYDTQDILFLVQWLRGRISLVQYGRYSIPRATAAKAHCQCDGASKNPSTHSPAIPSVAAAAAETATRHGTRDTGSRRHGRIVRRRSRRARGSRCTVVAAVACVAEAPFAPEQASGGGDVLSAAAAAEVAEFGLLFGLLLLWLEVWRECRHCCRGRRRYAVGDPWPAWHVGIEKVSLYVLA